MKKSSSPLKNKPTKKRTAIRSDAKYIDLQNAKKGKERELVARYGPIAAAADEHGNQLQSYYHFRYFLEVAKSYHDGTLRARQDAAELRDNVFHHLLNALDNGDVSFFEDLIASVKAIRAERCGNGVYPIAVKLLEAQRPPEDWSDEDKAIWREDMKPTAPELLKKIPSASSHESKKRTLQRFKKLLKVDLPDAPSGRPKTAKKQRK